ncbi:MAG: DUF2726 domain-containing protein [Ignavibacteriae bacterium]|nr:DUF2726 domain-containing protein [Ignavibacteriota bacterium]
MKSILILAVLVFIGYIVIEKIKQSESNSNFAKKPIDDIGLYFTLKKYFFTQSEKTFFNELVKQNNNQYTILSKVRLEDIVSAKKSLDWKEKGVKRNYIKSKHLDFVILDNHYGNILAVIELDGKSHDTEKQGKYDKIKDDILNTVGVKFYRVKVGEDFANTIKNLFIEIKGA